MFGRLDDKLESFKISSVGRKLKIEKRKTH